SSAAPLVRLFIYSVNFDVLKTVTAIAFIRQLNDLPFINPGS
ncbi:MAG: hypothetical protein V7641_4690, partial [Blastocatellia bacterium]